MSQWAVDDLWAADSGPTFVIIDRGGLAVVEMNFNGWGNRQVHDSDREIARQVAEYCGVPHFDSGFVAEGGAVEPDRDGTLLTTESALLNDNRNPGVSKLELEQRLKASLGVQKVIWLPGIRGQDVTDGHIDAFARYIRPGVVVVQVPRVSAGDWSVAAKEAVKILKASTDARGRQLEVAVVLGPSTVRSNSTTFVDSYIDYHTCNGGLITAEFGDKTSDAEARSVLERLHPDRRVVQLNVDRICEGGGGIHCATQEQPAI